jgi:hypothetical protein
VLLVIILKRGDLSRCENWRGITLLCAASKILTRVMLERMKDAVYKKLRENQAGLKLNEHSWVIKQPYESLWNNQSNGAPVYI